MSCAIPAAGESSEHLASSEYPLKAAFIYNFIKFTRWLGDKQGTDAPIQLVVVGPDKFGAALHELEQKKVAGRAIILTYATQLSLPESSPFQVVFISYEQPHRFVPVLQALKKDAVLTIGDAQGFAGHGGCIELVKQHDKIRFIINKDALKQHGLELSYKVYAMALEVIEEEGK